jgi:hypothetical protein
MSVDNSTARKRTSNRSRSGCRLPVDLLRTVAFAAYRCSLFALNKKKYTTTLSVVVRKVG